MKRLSKVHAMWIGEKLSRLELLTLASFLAKGHEVMLWAYDEIRTPLPRGVVVADAENIFPRAKIKPKRDAEPAIGIGKNSIGGVFSDLFRYRLLYEYGGIWTDMDVTALRPIDFTEDYVFRPHRLGMVGSVMKCPQGSHLMRKVYEDTEKIASEYTPWLLPIEILNEHVRLMGLEKFIIPNMSNRDKFAEIYPFIRSRQEFHRDWYVIHWMNERWRTLQLETNKSSSNLENDHVLDKDSPPIESTLHDLYLSYRLTS